MRINHTFEMEPGGNVIEMEIEASGPSKDNIQELIYYMTDADNCIEIRSQCLLDAINKYIDRHGLIDEAFRVNAEEHAISREDSKIENGYWKGL